MFIIVCVKLTPFRAKVHQTGLKQGPSDVSQPFINVAKQESRPPVAQGPARMAPRHRCEQVRLRVQCEVTAPASLYTSSPRRWAH